MRFWTKNNLFVYFLLKERPLYMASVKSVDEASVERKLNGAKNTQESIQSLCLWALHHKAQHDNIVKIWLNILKKC